MASVPVETCRDEFLRMNDQKNIESLRVRESLGDYSRWALAGDRREFDESKRPGTVSGFPWSQVLVS